MSAYGVKLLLRTCLTCRGRAVVEVWNSRNAPVGLFCGPHGIAMIKSLDEVEAADRQRTNKRRETS